MDNQVTDIQHFTVL